MMNLRSSVETKVLAAFTVTVLMVAMLAAGTWTVSGDAFAAALRVSQTHEVPRAAPVSAGRRLMLVRDAEPAPVLARRP